MGKGHGVQPEQNTVRQLDGIEVGRVFTDTASGKDTARPNLDEMVAFVRGGDIVLVHSMDRLARNLDDLRRLIRTLTDKGVRVEFVKEGLAFTGEDSPMATFMLIGDGRLRGEGRPGPRVRHQPRNPLRLPAHRPGSGRGTGRVTGHVLVGPMVKG